MILPGWQSTRAGPYLYAANASANSISIYCIVPASCVTGTPGRRVRCNRFLISARGHTEESGRATLDSTGSYLYVANQGSNNIGTYTITAGTGFPVEVTDAPFNSEAGRVWLRWTPNGGYLYVGNQGGAAGIQGVRNRQRKSEHHFYL